MKIETFVLGMVATNTYLVQNENTKEVVIIDPALCPDYLLGHIESEGLKPVAILLTHGHFDHILGIDGCVEAFDIPVYAHKDEKEVIEESSQNLSTNIGTGYQYMKGVYQSDGHMLSLGGYQFQVIHTPGHTKGGCCYYVEQEQVLFSGDTIFKGTYGRTDFPTGDEKTLMESICKKVLILPEKTTVYPGHEGLTTVGEEKKYYAHLKA